MMQGAAVRENMDRTPLTVGCLFTGGLSLEREWNGCNLAFACDNGFRGNPDSLFFVDFDRVSWWKAVAPFDLLVACQPRCSSLHACWMDTFCYFCPVPRIVLFHHENEWSSSSKIGFTTKQLKSFGYHTWSFCLKAELCGAATWLSYPVTFAVLSSLTDTLVSLPGDLRHLPLPDCSCHNIIVQYYKKPGVSDDAFLLHCLVQRYPCRFTSHVYQLPQDCPRSASTASCFFGGWYFSSGPSIPYPSAQSWAQARSLSKQFGRMAEAQNRIHITPFKSFVSLRSS